MGIIDGVTKDFEGNISFIDYKTVRGMDLGSQRTITDNLLYMRLLYYEHTGIVPKVCGRGSTGCDLTKLILLKSRITS